MPLLFVYGTLKRGCKNHRILAGQTFVAEARTAAGFRLYDLGDYPCMVPDETDPRGITGELWRIDEATRLRLDIFEGVSHGLFSRTSIPLAEPIDEPMAEAYVYQLEVVGHNDVGDTWRE